MTGHCWMGVPKDSPGRGVRGGVGSWASRAGRQRSKGAAMTHVQGLVSRSGTGLMYTAELAKIVQDRLGYRRSCPVARGRMGGGTLVGVRALGW